MIVLIQLLQIMVGFLVLAAIGGAVVVVWDWLEQRKPLRVPNPPRTQAQHLADWTRNERASKSMRGR